MNRTDLVRATARKSQVTIPVVEDVLSTFLDLVVLNLAVQEQVTLRGFGKFEPRVRPPVTLKDPQSGTPIDVPKRHTVVFLPSATLKERLNARPL